MPLAARAAPPGSTRWPTVKAMNRAGSLDVTRWPRPVTVGVVVRHPAAAAGVNA